MKSIITFSAVALLALGLSVTSAAAKGNKSTPPAKKTNAVDAYLKAHDTNKNGTIEPSEFQGSKTEFDKWDKNSDGKLDRGELGAMLGKK